MYLFVIAVYPSSRNKLTLWVLDKSDLTLDYDNTLIFSNKSDSKRTYKKKYGYCPGVGLIGDTDQKLEHMVRPYRLVVTKTKKFDGQTNMFTGEASCYSAILTDDYEMTNQEVYLQIYLYSCKVGEVWKVHKTKNIWQSQL